MFSTVTQFYKTSNDCVINVYYSINIIFVYNNNWYLKHVIAVAILLITVATEHVR